MAWEKVGGAKRDRTAGLYIANVALSQLSYSPNRDPEGIETIDSRPAPEFNAGTREISGPGRVYQARLESIARPRNSAKHSGQSLCQ